MKCSSKTWVLALLLVCLVMIIAYFAFWADSDIAVYDENFKMLDYSISRGGGAHIFYQGNQTLARTRLKLHLQYGLNLWRSPVLLCVADGPESLVLLVRYEGDFPFEQLNGLRATLTNGKDVSKELKGLPMREHGRETYIVYYTLPRPPTSDDSFRIDFRLKSADDPIASWRVGKLNKHNKEINAGL